jgi:hypothetical protein
VASTGKAASTDWGAPDGDYWQWLVALRAEPEFGDCAAVPGGLGPQSKVVDCEVTYGDGYFYQVTAVEPLTGLATLVVNPLT